MFKLKITIENAAFEDAALEVARILREVARQVEEGREYGRLIDVIGNVIGDYTF